jgi:hypothetical protein
MPDVSNDGAPRNPDATDEQLPPDPLPAVRKTIQEQVRDAVTDYLDGRLEPDD